MDDHPVVLQEGVEPASVFRRKRQDLERVSGKVEQEKKKDGNDLHHRQSVRDDDDILFPVLEMHHRHV